MQITIHKGPNDQTKRFVNSDITHLKCERVIFGDKKYIDLLCPHCKTTSVTFNVSINHYSIFILTPDLAWHKSVSHMNFNFKLL